MMNFIIGLIVGIVGALVYMNAAYLCVPNPFFHIKGWF